MVECVADDYKLGRPGFCKWMDDTPSELLGPTTLRDLINEVNRQEHEGLIQLTSGGQVVEEYIYSSLTQHCTETCSC